MTKRTGEIALEELSIDAIHSALEHGRYTAKELVDAYLKRIQSIDREESGPQLNSIVALNKNATAEAAKVDDFFYREGRFVGPLHGIPVVVKDNIETAGLTTTFGSVIAKDFVPKEDATLVAKLKGAGAIILGKTSMPDWGTDWFSTSSLFKQVRNPYNLECDPGASSSGTAAAVAANLAAIGLGSDSAGSIRLPSSFCNLVGMRPTVGLLSESGCAPGVKGQGVIGPIGRTVKDIALAMDVLAGFDEKDILTSVHAMAGSPEGGSYAARLGKANESSVKLGVLRSLFGDDKISEQAEVNSVTNNILDTLKSAGCEVLDAEIPNLKHYMESTSLMLARNRPDLDVFLKSRFETSLLELYSSGKYPSENAMIPYIAELGVASQYDFPAYARQLDTIEEFQKVVLSVILKHNLSALVCPTAKLPARLSAQVDQNIRATFPTNTTLASQLHFPAISVPVGFTSAGLPVGLELIGAPQSDQDLLDLAYIVERRAKARRPPELKHRDRTDKGML